MDGRMDGWFWLIAATSNESTSKALVSDLLITCKHTLCACAAWQDCYAGCEDPYQAFYGTMDEVRIWKVARTQDQIVRSMRSKWRDVHA